MLCYKYGFKNKIVCIKMMPFPKEEMCIIFQVRKEKEKKKVCL